MNSIQVEAFFSACVSGDIQVVRKLVGNGDFPLETKNDQGWTGLVMACFNENHELAKLLIASGADVNATNTKGTTVFMYAKTPIQAKQSETNFLSYLLSKGANINTLDHKGKSVLDYVLENQCQVLAQWLIANGAKKGGE